MRARASGLLQETDRFPVAAVSMMGPGVFAGASKPEPGTGAEVEAALDEGRHLRQQRRTPVGRERDRLELAAANHAQHRRDAAESICTLLPMTPTTAGRAAGIGHVHDFRPGQRLEQLGGEVRARARAIGGVVQLARTRLEIRHQLRHGIDRQRRGHHQQAGAVPISVIGARSRSGSNGSLRYSDGLAASPKLPIARV